MAEYIDRDALKDRKAYFVPPFIDESNQAYVDGLTDAYTLICQAPTTDLVERKTGEWIGYPECLKYTNAYSDDHIVCSACEECFSILDNDCERFNFCPNCGAKMEG